MKKIKLLLVEDNRLLRDGITAMINREKDLTVIPATGNGVETMKRIEKLQPGVLLLDIGLSRQNSLHLVTSVRDKHPEIKIIVMDLIPMQHDVITFVQAGVSGFLMKDATLADFTNTIRMVAHGSRILPPHLTGSLFSQIIDQAMAGPGRAILKNSIQMTRRERQVIQLISEGLPNKEIAHNLHLSPATVKSHVHNILEKLALRSRVQIANYARLSGEFREAAESVSLMDHN